MNSPHLLVLVCLALLRLAGRAAGQGGAAPAAEGGLRLTVTGQQCHFPAVYNGRVITECIQIGRDGRYCQVAVGNWEECAGAEPLRALAPSTEAGPGGGGGNATVLAANGQPCLNPIFLGGQPVYGCVAITEGFYCWLEDGGGWEACVPPAPRGSVGDIGGESLTVIPFNPRFTTTGQQCLLPFVDDSGTVIDDCLDFGSGVLECPNLNGTVQPCAPRAATAAPAAAGAAPGAAGAQQLLFQPRETVDGEDCVLPYVQGGVLNLGCSPSNLCPTATGALRPCAPATETLHPLDVATDPWANRTVPGLAGFPCAVAPEGTCPAELCAPGLSCYPLEALGVVSGYGLAFVNLGSCGESPPGGDMGIFKALEDEGSVQPVAFVPLSGEEGMRNFLLPPDNATAEGVAFLEDPLFQTVPLCSQEDNSSILVPSFPYTAGPAGFTVNVWVALDPAAPPVQGRQWIYVHSANPREAVLGQPDQVAIFLEGAGPGEPPLIGGSIADSNDTWLDPSGPSIPLLLSDGSQYALANGSAQLVGRVSITDGDWHMLTLSTQAPRSIDANTEAPPGRGLRLFVDGMLVGSLSDSPPPPGLAPWQVPGGDGMRLASAPALLCTAPQRNTAQAFNGQLAHLMLFPQALQASDVQALAGAYFSAFNATLARGYLPPELAALLAP